MTLRVLVILAILILLGSIAGFAILINCKV